MPVACSYFFLFLFPSYFFSFLSFCVFSVLFHCNIINKNIIIPLFPSSLYVPSYHRVYFEALIMSLFEIHFSYVCLYFALTYRNLIIIFTSDLWIIAGIIVSKLPLFKITFIYLYFSAVFCSSRCYTLVVEDK